MPAAAERVMKFCGQCVEPLVAEATVCKGCGITYCARDAAPADHGCTARRS